MNRTTVSLERVDDLSRERDDHVPKKQRVRKEGGVNTSRRPKERTYTQRPTAQRSDAHVCVRAEDEKRRRKQVESASLAVRQRVAAFSAAAWEEFAPRPVSSLVFIKSYLTFSEETLEAVKVKPELSDRPFRRVGIKRFSRRVSVCFIGRKQCLTSAEM